MNAVAKMTSIAGLLDRRLIAAWAELAKRYESASPVTGAARDKGRPCGLVVNQEVIADLGPWENFSLARPHVVGIEHGIVLHMSRNALGLFKPILIRYEQLRAVGFFPGHAEYELEFQKDGLHGFLRIRDVCGDCLDLYRLYGFEAAPEISSQGVGEEKAQSSASTAYSRAYGCSRWVADALATLDPRDPVDALHDVEALWQATFERHRHQSWKMADILVADPSTSYWLSSKLSEVRARFDAQVLEDVQALVHYVRERLSRMDRGHIPLDALVDCNSLEHDAGS